MHIWFISFFRDVIYKKIKITRKKKNSFKATEHSEKVKFSIKN